MEFAKFTPTEVIHTSNGTQVIGEIIATSEEAASKLANIVGGRRIDCSSRSTFALSEAAKANYDRIFRKGNIQNN